MRLCSVLLLIALPAVAGTVRLVWSPSATADVTYRIYASTNAAFGVTNALGFQDVGTNLTATATTETAGKWYFLATSRTPTAESAPSNVEMAVVPEPPGTLGTLAIEASLAGTNWMQVYRLKITSP